MKTKVNPIPNIMIISLVASTIGIVSSLAAGKEVVYSDNFEANVKDGGQYTSLGPPQVGTYLPQGASQALPSDAAPPGAHGGSTFLSLDRTGSPRKDLMRCAFAKSATVGNRDSVHAEVWLRWEAGLVQWGLDSSEDGYGAVVTIWGADQNNRVTVYDGGAHVDAGLVQIPNTWQKYELDYTVGSSQVTLTVGGVSANFPTPARTQIQGLWMETSGSGSLGYADDVMASIQPGQAPATGNVLFKDGFERSTVGQEPGVFEPEVGSYLAAGTGIEVLSGPSFGGPSAAHSGQNYVVVDRANTGGRPALSALFNGGAFPVETNAFHIEFYRWQPAIDNNYGNIAVGNSTTDFGSDKQLFYGISWPDLRWRAYSGADYIDSGLSFTAESWDKVELDWDGARLMGRLNGGTPAEMTLFGTSGNTVDRLYFETSGGGTIFYLDDLYATFTPVTPAPTKVLSFVPKDKQTDVPVDTTIQVKLADGAQQVQGNSIRLSLNSARVTPVVTQALDPKGTQVTTITYDPADNFPFGSTNTVSLVYNDNASPPNVSTINATFVAATGLTLFADNFEDSRPKTNIVQFSPYEGTGFLEINRKTGQRPTLVANSDESFASDAGDELRIQFGVRVLTGEVSLYPRQASTGTSSSDDTGQLGFWSDGRIGIVDPTGNFFQFLTQQMDTNGWNSVVVKYVNGSGEWAISVNGQAFEAKTGMGSDGGSFGLNVAGFKLKCDADGVSYLDGVSITNVTKGTLMFAANFDNGVGGEAPAATDPQVGAYVGITGPGLANVGAFVREVVVDAPPNAPQAGSYGLTSALVKSDTAHSGTKAPYLYPALGQGDMRVIFTTAVPQGVKLHAEAWIYHIGQKVHWGLDTPANHSFVNVTLQPPDGGRVITVSDGTADVDTGLVYAESTWEKYQIDYVVGANQVILTVNDQSVTNTVQPQNEVQGLWFVSGLEGDDFQSRGYVDDVLASAPVTITTAALRYQVSGKQLTFSWDGSGFTLQSSDTVPTTAGWTNAGTASPVTVPIGGGNKFYRLRK